MHLLRLLNVSIALHLHSYQMLSGSVTLDVSDLSPYEWLAVNLTLTNISVWVYN
jgi:hypothetical protein